MHISCSSCQKSYNLPDAKLPFGKKINFACPACKANIELDLRNPPDEEAASDKLVFKPISEETDSVLTIDEIKKKIIKRIDDLPPMPKVLFKARTVLSDENSSFKDISTIIETDQAIAAKILKVANSAYYGLSGMVSSIHQASVVLGYQTLEQVITMVSTSSLLGKQLRGYQLNAGALWRHSLAVALASKHIASKRAPSIESDAFSVGLIHDAGKLALDPYVLKKRKDIDRYLRDDNPSFLQAERTILGFDHTEIAQDLSDKWKLPEDHGKAIRYHHTPDESGGNQLAHIVHIANHIATEAGFGGGRGFDTDPVNEQSMKNLRLKQEFIEDAKVKLAASVEEITASLSG